MRPSLLLLVVADVALAAWLISAAALPSASPLVAQGEKPALPVPTAAATAPNAVSPAQLEALLQRPLFAPDRRPAAHDAPAPAAAPAAAPATLPRMSAIIIYGDKRSAIFAQPDGKPLVVSEGGHVGPFTVLHIAPERVLVDGPAGQHLVRTRFEPGPPDTTPVLPPGMPPPVFPGAPGLMNPGLRTPPR